MPHRSLFDTDVKTHFDAWDLARWTGGRWLGAPPTAITGFSIDTRTLEPGDLFVALAGEHNDGHQFVAEAWRRGAAAAMITDESCLHGVELPRLQVSDTTRALMDAAAGYRATLQCRMVAITGSVGKTTVKELIADMAQPIGVTARTRGNWNNHWGMPLSLLAAPPETQFGVFEIGMNHPGELAPLCQLLAPDISLVTCVGPVHIENFADETGIAHEKATVYRSLSGTGVAVINADDPYAPLMREAAGGHRVVEVSEKHDADFTFRRADPASGRFVMRERATGEAVELTAPLPGHYFVLDAALSAAVARELGVPWPVIRHAIQFYQPLAMRWNRHVWDGIHMVNDAYNANPVSLRAAVQAFGEEATPGRRWLVLAGMLELGVNEETLHRESGAFLVRFPGVKLVAVGRRGAWLAEGARAAGLPSDDIHVLPDHEAAARLLDRELKPGDAVLFKASRGEAVEKVLAAWKTLRGIPANGLTT